MPLDADELASMYAEVVRGVRKRDSLFANRDAASSASWDRIAAEVDASPGSDWSIPNEVPRAV